MAKITTVYMTIKGEMQPFSMKEYLAMREDDARIRGLKFIPIDSRMYEATPEQFKEWQKERDERRNDKKRQKKANTPKYKLTYQSVPDTDEDIFETLVIDDACDVEETALDNLMGELLRLSIAQLAPSEQELITALFYDGMTEREYAIKSGIPQKTINDRKRRILLKLKKIIETKK